MSATLGIDFGGSGIKGSIVALDSGNLIGERIRIPTPQPSIPDRIADTIHEIASSFEDVANIGCTIPGVVRDGHIFNATNLHESWEGFNALEFLSSRLAVPVTLLNDADAAGMAEMEFGAGRDFRDKGMVMMLTFGTGIGSAIFIDGHLVPNTELGLLELDGEIAEARAAGRLRRQEVLSWDDWLVNVQKYLTHIEILFSPDLIIFGGGISRDSSVFLHKLKCRASLVPALLQNDAGIVGAATAAASGSD